MIQAGWIIALLPAASHGFPYSHRIWRAPHDGGRFRRRDTVCCRAQNEQDPGLSDRGLSKGGDENDSPALKSTRCPDFPSFAATNLKRGAGTNRTTDRVSVRTRCELPDCDDDDTGEGVNGSISWSNAVVKADIPMEPGFSLSVINEARRTRFLEDRTYACRESFEIQNLKVPPGLNDLDTPPPDRWSTFWISIPARLLSFGIPFLSFPSLMNLLSQTVANTVEPEQLSNIASDFAPGVSILYGTFISLTLSVLYNRQKNLQDDISLEASLLLLMARNLLSLFRSEDPQYTVVAAQCVADQVRHLVKSSRGTELTCLMYHDTYSRMLELVETRECQLMTERNGEVGGHGILLGSCRDTLKEIVKARSKRLSDEALSLPPTHFFVLTTLTLLVLLGYCVSVLPTVAANAGPPLESSGLFGILCTVYVFFYNFCNDLNNPFEGVYQIRRSSAASHLLEIKWLLVNHPYLRDGQVDFEEVAVAEEDGQVMINSPGLGNMWYEKKDIYPDQS